MNASIWVPTGGSASEQEGHVKVGARQGEQALIVRVLPPDIVSLVHHVQLNETGWWKKAVSQIIKGVLWTANEEMSVPDLRRHMFDMLQVRVGDGVLESQLAILHTQNSVLLEAGKYRLTEASRRDLSRSNEEAKSEQTECKDSFVVSCKELCPTVDPEVLWVDFSNALIRTIRISGANLYHLIRDGKLRRNHDWMEGLSSKYGPECEAGLIAVAERFFSPENHACRSQVLRFLTAHFFAEATQFNPETINAIEKGKKSRSIKLVLDTNFIFSLLGLHENPADDAVKSLVDLAANSKGKLEIKLYVLPSTIDEAKKVLAHQVGSIEAIRPTRAIASAAVSQPLSSIAKKFFENAKKVGGISASDFFQPYIDDLKTILESHKIKVLEAQREVYHQHQDIIDDVHVELEAEARKPENMRKGYEALLHDAVLWRVVADRRDIKSESPFDVEFWGVSIDWRLINFDRRKRDRVNAKVPVILHPANLVQLLQFWVPRTGRLEDTLIDAIKLPLFFQSFDVEDEKATLKVLEQLSRFEQIDDLPEAVLRQVLANKVLRTRISQVDASNDDDAFELVKDEIISINQDQAVRLDETRDKLATTATLLDGANLSLSEAQIQLAETDSKLKEEQDENSRLGNVLGNESLLRAAAELRLEKMKYALIFFGAPAIPAILLALASYVLASKWGLDSSSGWKLYLYMILPAFLIPFFVTCAFAGNYLRNRSSIQQWLPARVSSFAGRKFVAVLLLAAVAIVQGGVWDGVKMAYSTHKASEAKSD